jgi:signal peptidase I
MIQYVKFTENTVENAQFETPAGSKAFVLLSKKVIFFIFMIYAFLFLAVATPFLPPHSKIVYGAGAVICLGILVRLVIAFHRYFSCGQVRITIHKTGITYAARGATTEVHGASIRYLEHNLFGDLVIRGQNADYIFPMILIDKKKRKELMALFADMAPSRTRLIRQIWELGDAVVMAMILAVHIIQYVIQNFYIPTGSMKDTLIEGDHLFAEKITFGPIIPKMAGMKSEIHLKIPLVSRDIQRGDIIIFNPPEGEVEKDYIKRCIAVAGDEFHIKDNAVYINGKKQEEKYTKGFTNYHGFTDKTRIEGKVKEGYVIAMGDNREHSQDSRYFGYVPVERIKAKAYFLYFNLEQMRTGNFARFGLIR